MTCFDPRPSAPDTLNQLAGLGDFFGTVFNGIASAGNWVSNNSTAITNIIDAAGRLKAQTAAAKAGIQSSYNAGFVQPSVPQGLTPAQWQQMQAANVYTPNATATTPSWLIPAALAAGALVLVLVLTKRGGGEAHG